MTITQARLEIASRWHEKSGVWMTPAPGESAQARLTRLAKDVVAKVRTVDDIVQYAPGRTTPYLPLEPVPAWVVDPSIATF